ncbi:MAG TPA: hypothetical protein V6C89_21780 [Drouetiella sp.]
MPALQEHNFFILANLERIGAASPTTETLVLQADLQLGSEEEPIHVDCTNPAIPVWLSGPFWIAAVICLVITLIPSPFTHFQLAVTLLYAGFAKWIWNNPLKFTELWIITNHRLIQVSHKRTTSYKLSEFCAVNLHLHFRTIEFSLVQNTAHYMTDLSSPTATHAALLDAVQSSRELEPKLWAADSR